MSLLRVALLVPEAQPSTGWGRYAVELATELRAANVEPVMLTASHDMEAALDGIEHHAVLPRLFVRRFELARNLRAVPRVARLLTTCDAVHVLAEPYLPLAALAADRRHALLLTAHGTWAVRPFATSRRPFWIPALRRVDLLVCQSRYTRDAMARLVTLPRSIVQSAGVRSDRFAPAAGSARPAWLPSGPIVLTVAALKSRKGIHVALEAVAIARQRHPDLQWIVVGHSDPDSPYVQSIQSRARALGAADSMHLTGTLAFDDVVAAYQHATVFMMLPTMAHGAFEGLGLVYLEAGAAGVPSIGTRDCGAEDAIVHEETGLLVPPDNAQAAADALDRLLADADWRTRLGAAARAYAVARTWSRLAQVLAGEYLAAIERRRGAR